MAAENDEETTKKRLPSAPVSPIETGMRKIGCLWTLLAAVILSGTPSARSEDGPWKRLFPGEKAPARPGRAATKESRERDAAFFGGAKRVEIDLTAQTLRAYEGKRLVMKSRISSGRNGATPTGRFSAGGKDADHFSSLYHNAPMPWSVQVHGHIFIHGFSLVPDHPASHGCIRLPLTGNNPAKRFFNWVEPGTPIRIAY